MILLGEALDELSETESHSPALNLNENNSNWNDLGKHQIDNVNNLVVTSININSIRNKCYKFKLLVNDNGDILIVEETKIDDNFLAGQYFVEGYMPPF